MQSIETQEENRRNLLKRIVPILIEKGLKQTTMDSVASSLGISKRTLYEIFGSKSEMLKAAIDFMAQQNQEFYNQTFATAPNVMEALVITFKHIRDLMGRVNINFYRDMDRLYKDKREDFEKVNEKRHEKMLEMFQRGVEEGMFRSDVDFGVQSRIMGLQMEGLKRMEELFPKGITLQRVFDAIILGFLRSIASKKGMKELEKLFPGKE